ncbi:hypothetical protein [Halorhabdus amylolytica]|uniref:hypothetical protein n=1 Tax=Halorhabdus amylolytica TaxID=2559573 RepID=UPI0010AA6DEA|nr:hypothetical protein [Halorhabdus amylolytica]
MTRLSTRRGFLALAAAGATAGCLGRGNGFWDDPPAFDRSGLESVTDRPVPDRPAVIPVTLTEAQRGTLRERVESRLATIPDPLTAEVLPNGTIREAIVDHRAEARSALGRMRSASTTVETVEAAADAAAHAGRAAAAWAAVLVDRSPADVVLTDAQADERVQRAERALPGRAADAQSAIVVYGVLESWLSEASHHRLAGGTRSPLRVGRDAATNERAWAWTTAAPFVRARYESSLADPEPFGDALEDAVATLAEPTRERLVEFRRSESADMLYRQPDRDALVERDVRRGEPGMALLGEKLDEVYPDYHLRTVVWSEQRSYPAYRLRETHWVYAALDALETVIARIEDGADLFPSDAAAVRSVRREATDAVDVLAGSNRPLERFVASRLARTLTEADEALTDSDSDKRTIASVYGEYVWARLVADATPAATETIASALE